MKESDEIGKTKTAERKEQRKADWEFEKERRENDRKERKEELKMVLDAVVALVNKPFIMGREER